MKPRRTNSRILCGSIAGLSVVAMTSSVLAADPDVAAILNCKALQDDAARLACYDQLNSPAGEKPSPTRSAPVASPPPAPVETTPAVPPVTEKTKTVRESAAPVLDDDIGRENMGADVTDRLLVRGRVVACSASRSGKLTFTFANGQVWRQKDNKKVRWRDCNFDVGIRKDFFGYIMKRDDDDKAVRIARVK